MANVKSRLMAAGRGAALGVTLSTGWLGDRIEDTAGWLSNLIRFLPTRLARIARSLAVGLKGIVLFFPVGVRVLVRGGPHHLAAWLKSRLFHLAMGTVQFVLEILDLVGVPELLAALWRALTRATPLTSREIAAVATLFGPTTLRFHDIRVAEGGLLRLIFALNRQRAFATFHTINLPFAGEHQRANLAVLAHEMVHVLQYERAGSRYFVEALFAQGREGYAYGGSAGLRRARLDGKRLADFNREQQAQIVQDYFSAAARGADLEAYEPFIEELRAGRL